MSECNRAPGGIRMVLDPGSTWPVCGMRDELLEAERVYSIVAAFFTVFNYFGGGGMCEAAYTGKLVARQRLDMVVDDRVIVECKATDRLPSWAGPQLIGYLRATLFHVGVLLHFGPHPKFYRYIDSLKKSQKR